MPGPIVDPWTERRPVTTKRRVGTHISILNQLRRPKRPFSCGSSLDLVGKGMVCCGVVRESRGGYMKVESVFDMEIWINQPILSLPWWPSLVRQSNPLPTGATISASAVDWHMVWYGTTTNRKARAEYFCTPPSVCTEPVTHSSTNLEEWICLEMGEYWYWNSCISTANQLQSE